MAGHDIFESRSRTAIRLTISDEMPSMPGFGDSRGFAAPRSCEARTLDDERKLTALRRRCDYERRAAASRLCRIVIGIDRRIRLLDGIQDPFAVAQEARVGLEIGK
jgi:hypothetical protein